MSDSTATDPVPLRVLAREWLRIGVTGFGGPPVHMMLLRRLVVDRRKWIDERAFEDAIAACNLLPGPASTQLMIFCARRVRGAVGAIVGGLCFVVPAVVMVTALSVAFLGAAPSTWIRGVGAGAGSAVAAVAVSAGLSLLGPSWARAGSGSAPARRIRWLVYAGLGALAGAAAGAYVVLVLLGCGFAELAIRTRLGGRLRADGAAGLVALASAAVGGVGGVGALAWVAFKVGALSYGGGFVIVPLMRGDAVHTYHWMTSSQFLSAVALGQVTPGPVIATVAAVGYAADGVGGAALAALIAFLPSFLIVLFAGGRFEQLRRNTGAQAFLDGAGPAAIGAILGAAVPLAGALREWWQFVLLGAALVALVVVRRPGIVATLLITGAVGAAVGIAGGPLP